MGALKRYRVSHGSETLCRSALPSCTRYPGGWMDGWMKLTVPMAGLVLRYFQPCDESSLALPRANWSNRVGVGGSGVTYSWA